MPVKVTDILRAGLFGTFAWIKNNRWLLFSMIIWPYLTAFLLIALGMVYGSLETYRERLGVSNPILYILAGSGIVMSSLFIIDTVATTALYHRWLGTLPYLMLTPTRMYKVLVIEPLPGALISSTMGILAVIPGAVYFEGFFGACKLLIVLLLVYMGMLPLIGLSVIVASMTLVLREESNVAAFLTPLILLVSGVFYPLEILPQILQYMSRIFPTSYIVEASRMVATYTIPEFRALLIAVYALVALTLIYNGVASIALTSSERMVKRSGVI